MDPLPSADAFAALARSSPWRWTTLRFTVRWTGRYPTWAEPVRARLRRPDRLRVETVAGELVQLVRQEPRTVGFLTSDGGRTVGLPRVGEPGAGRPQLRPDGLVAARPGESAACPDDPMFQDYRWVAMLDPAELADGLDRDTGGRLEALDVDAVVVVDHGGRPAWETVVRTRESYEPRCSCCPLLRSRSVDLLEGDGVTLLDEYPEAHRVRLDVQTGVCVLTEEIGGLTPGAGHDLRIEAVDEPMADHLFR